MCPLFFMMCFVLCFNCLVFVSFLLIVLMSCVLSAFIVSVFLCLCKARFLSWNVAPLFDDRLFDLPWVGSGSGADLLRDINTFLGGLKLGHEFGYMLTGSLGLK